MSIGKNHTIKMLVHENYYTSHSFWRLKPRRIILTEVIHFRLLYLSRLFCLLNPNRDASQGTQRQQKKGERGEEDTEPSLLCVSVGADERGWEDMERVSCGAAVCSEWASCSLLILVSQCPLSSQALPKRRTGTASLHCTQ